MSEVVAVKRISLVYDCTPINMQIEVDGYFLDAQRTLDFAIADGFKDVRDMQQEFERMDELPLVNGIVIYWK